MKHCMMIGALCFSAIAWAQTPADGPPTGPRLPTGSVDLPPGAGTKVDPKKLPDLSGVWGRVEGLQHPDQTKIIPFMKPAAAADWQKKIAAKDFYVPWSNCEPTAFPAMLTEMGLPFEILMTPGRLTMIVPDGQVRRIYTDGSTHGEPMLGGTYFGNATARWDGETLVVETTDLRADNNVVMGLKAGTDAMKVVERLRLISKDKLQDDITITGLDYLQKPYQVTQVFQRYPQVRLSEFVCLASKNRNTGDKVDLTPPPL
ncbi:MAG: hypothetical protein QM808_14795 [Steroidobacteraceae bacterium]